MEQHSNVSDGKAKDITGLGGGKFLDLAQLKDLALLARKGGKTLGDACGHLS